jgi:hypothetical protein
MRLVSWNCLSSLTPKKQEALDALKYDIAVVPEARLANLKAMGLPSERFRWIGPTSGHGLAVVAHGSWSIETVPRFGDDDLFLPVVCRNGETSFQLLAVCTKPKPSGNYVGPLSRSLHAYADWIASGPTVVAGDFNASVWFDKSGPKFRQLLDRLHGMGLVSAWHDFHRQEHGKESQPTLFQTKKRDMGYHIDFVFLPRSGPWMVKDINIGKYDDWVTSFSDHVPVIVDLTPKTGSG